MYSWAGQPRVKYTRKKDSWSHMCAYKYKLNVGGLEHIQIADKIRYNFEIDSELEVASKEDEFGTRWV